MLRIKVCPTTMRKLLIIMNGGKTLNHERSGYL